MWSLWNTEVGVQPEKGRLCRHFHSPLLGRQAIQDQHETQSSFDGQPQICIACDATNALQASLSAGGWKQLFMDRSSAFVGCFAPMRLSLNGETLFCVEPGPVRCARAVRALCEKSAVGTAMPRGSPSPQRLSSPTKCRTFGAFLVLSSWSRLHHAGPGLLRLVAAQSGLVRLGDPLIWILWF